MRLSETWNRLKKLSNSIAQKGTRNYELFSNLQGSEVRIDWEDVDQLQRGEDVSGGEEALGDEGRVPVVPLLPGQRHRVASRLSQNLVHHNDSWNEFFEFLNYYTLFVMYCNIIGCIGFGWF